jgi:hypothetical protein
MTKMFASAWPYLFAIILACLVSFPTWSLLKLSGLGDAPRLILTVAGFAIVSSGLVVYMRCCMQRHLYRRHRVPG